MKNIYICGLSRSGSTRLYLTVIKMYEMIYGYNNVSSGYCINPNNTINVIKVHKEIEKVNIKKNDILFFPVRDMRDCYVSTKNNRFFEDVTLDYFITYQKKIT